jgi:hypothetical protein
MRPSPLQLRFEVRFTTPLTTCPHAAFVDDAPEVSPGCCCCCCCPAAGVAIPIVSVLNAIRVTNTDAAIRLDAVILRLRVPSSSILKSKYL